MAEATVSVLNKLASLTIPQGSGGEHGALTNIPGIQNKLKDVRCLLRDAETKADEDEGVKKRIRQLTEICYEVEDTLDDIQPLRPRPDNQRSSILKKTMRLFDDQTLSHKLEKKMASVQKSLSEISDDLKKSYSSIAEDETILPRSAAADDDGRDDVVGTEKAVSYLIDWLLDKEPRLTAVSVVGMGGSGKTTVAKRVYNIPRVRDYFNCQAWIPVSQDFEIRTELCRQLAPMEDSSSSSRLSKPDLAACLKNQRFLIVLDDVRHVDVWESLRNALPDGQLGSRVLITTRMRDVALSTYGPVYELQFLKMDESRTLFHRKAFPSTGVCPEELADTSDEILRRCGGLPLAITVVGALLSSKGPDKEKWETLRRSFSSQMEANPYSQAQMRALKLSYRNLPYGLRACFLYLTLFPDDAPIRFSKLARLWAAERLLQTSSSDHSVEEAEAAEGCLSALVRRSLVQVSDSYDDGRVRSCQVHDIIREMICPIAKELDFAAAASSCPAGDVQSFQNVRRISISNKNNSDDVSQHLQLGGFRCLRSLLISGRFQSLERSLHSATPSWRLLRVFDLEGTTLQSFPIGIENLVFLRYLSFRNTNITEFPKSLSKLVRLETLDLRGNQISSLPAQIAKLEALRHLLVGSRAKKGVLISSEIGKLTELRTLKYIDFPDKQTQRSELGKLKQIRSLCLSNWKKEDESIPASVQQMTQLISFKAASEGDGEIDMDALPSVSSSLQRLLVKGSMKSNKLPDPFPSRSSLVKIHLQGSGLTTDPFGVLESLPRLAVLNLFQAYNGEELCCDNPEGFPELKVLNLVGLHQLHSLRVKKGAMKCLRKLQFDSCDKLQSLPEDIKHLSQLRELGFINAKSALIEKIKSYKQTKDAIVDKIIIKPAERSQPQS